MPELFTLSNEADDYFRTLPGLIYPQALVNQFARIANRIAELRYDEPQLQDYFESLLNDNRAGRRGFPPSVLQDIQCLCEMMMEPVTPAPGPCLGPVNH